eukprot:gene5145-7165_t
MLIPSIPIANCGWNPWSDFLPTGNISGTRCTAEAVRNANDYQLNSILSELINTKYFRLVRVNIAKNSPEVCSAAISGQPIASVTWANNDADEETHQSTDGDCSAEASGFGSYGALTDSSSFTEGKTSSSCSIVPESNNNDNSVEFSITTEEMNLKSDYFNDTCSTPPEVNNKGYVSNSVQSNLSFRSTWKQRNFTFWHDLCDEILPHNLSGSVTQPKHTEYVNVILNPERNTGYNGSELWAAIYSQNCLSSNELVFSSNNNYYGQHNQPESDSKCYEERVLYRLLSGWHTSVSVHISSEYSYSINKWQPNLDKFMNTVGNYPDRLENLHFAYVVALRALFKARDLLYLNSWDYNTGNLADDTHTKSLMRHLLDSSSMSLCSPLVFGFDETTMFNLNPVDQNNILVVNDIQLLEKKFKVVFKNIARLVGCVKCEKCRLHGKIAIHGIGAMLKVLLTPIPTTADEISKSHDYLKSIITRDDIVALVNVLHKFSHSLKLSEDLLALQKERLTVTASTDLDLSSNRINLKPLINSTHQNELIELGLASLSIYSKDKRITKYQEDLLVDLLMNKNENILRIVKYFGDDSDSFMRHSLRFLSSSKDISRAYDVIVVGGGMAGMVCAIAAADRGCRVLLVDKMPRLGGNSAKASSGINMAQNKTFEASFYDDKAAFLKDTLKSANGSGVAKLAEILVSESSATIEWLKSRTNIKLDLVGQLGGHSKSRTMRPSDGLVGSELVAALQGVIHRELSDKITIINNANVVRLLTSLDDNMNMDAQSVIGIEYVDISNSSSSQPHGRVVFADSIVLASGGFGFHSMSNTLLQRFRPDLIGVPTTLGSQTTGDGIVLAESIGADLIDMEFVQLHPTGFIDPIDPSHPNKVLAGEILRGVGGLLFNGQGKRFCDELGTRSYVVDRMYAQTSAEFWIVLTSSMAALAERQITAYLSKGLLKRVTFDEMLLEIATQNKNNSHDISESFNSISIIANNIRNELDNYSNLHNIGLYNKTHYPGTPFNMSDESMWLIGRVTPVVHYTMGGILVDENSRVLRNNSHSIISGLFAIGEVSGGVHGQNRLGGNSLLECAVFGRRVGSFVNSSNMVDYSSQVFQARPVQLDHSTKKDFKIMSMKEISSHNSKDDCWTVLFSGVYDLTGYDEQHPGGAEPILKVCGRNGTSEFLEIHSFSMLRDSGMNQIGIIENIARPPAATDRAFGAFFSLLEAILLLHVQLITLSTCTGWSRDTSKMPDPMNDIISSKVTSEYLVKVLSSQVYGLANETSLTYAANLSNTINNTVYLKREDTQPVFSFKIRGAYNKISKLTQEQRNKGVVTCSAGNHAQGVALSSAKLGINAIIVMPEATPKIKVDAVARFGGKTVKIVLHGKNYDEAAAEAKRLVIEKQLTMIHPFDDPDVIAGQGTIGLEILKSLSSDKIDAIFLCVGGGGLLAGVAAYVKAIRPDVKLIGVEAEDAAGMTESLKAGKVVTLPSVGLFADGAAVRTVGNETFRICNALVDEMVTVNNDQICAAIKHGFNDTRCVMEPAGALAIAGMVKYIKNHRITNKTLVAITSGANMDFDRLRFVTERADSSETLMSVTIPERPGSFRDLYSLIFPRNVTEFSYRHNNTGNANVFFSFQAISGSSIEDDRIVLQKILETSGYHVTDLSDNDMAKDHARHLAGGRSVGKNGHVGDGDENNSNGENGDDRSLVELVYRFEFPESPGALNKFLFTLNHFNQGWSISLFHYRNHGHDYGRVLVGLLVHKNERKAFEQFLVNLDYKYYEETKNLAYQQFIK